MSLSSPITNRVQKALYMKSSALKQGRLIGENTDIAKPSGDPIYVDSSKVEGRKQTILTGQPTETPAEYATKKIQKTAKETYTNAMLRADGKAAGMSDAELDAQEADANAYNMAKFGTLNPTAEGKTDNTRSVGEVDADGNPIMIDDPSGEQVMTKPAGKGLVTKETPQDFRVHSQLSAGQVHRGNRKKTNTTMRTERKLGAFKGESPSGKKRWTKQEKKLYAAQLLSGKDRGYGTGIGIGGQSYESNKMIFQQGVGDTETDTFTNIDNPKYATKQEVEVEGKKAGTSYFSDLLKKLEKEKAKAKGISMVSPLKARRKLARNFIKGFKKGVDPTTTKKGTTSTSKVDPTPSTTKPTPDTTKQKGNPPGYTIESTPSKPRHIAPHTAKRITKPKNPKTLDTKPSIVRRIINHPLAPGGKTATYILGAGTYAGLDLFMGDGDDGTPPVIKNDDGSRNGGGGGDTTIQKDDTTPKKKTTTKITTPVGGDGGDIKVTGVDSGILVRKTKTPDVTGSATISDKLSKSMQKFNERQERKNTRVTNRQNRKDTNLESRQKRRLNRRTDPSIVGGALRKTFGGKKYNTNINNMGVVTTSGYKQKDKKKRGNASSWGSTYSV